METRISLNHIAAALFCVMQDRRFGSIISKTAPGILIVWVDACPWRQAVDLEACPLLVTS